MAAERRSDSQVRQLCDFSPCHRDAVSVAPRVGETRGCAIFADLLESCPR
jgi:hypothetical protein